MGVVISPDSELGKELAKWEKPYIYQHYPLMVYKALVKENGKATVNEPIPMRYLFPPGPQGDQMWDSACRVAEELTRRCQRIVHNESEEIRAKNEGWCLKQDEALERHEAVQREIADAAAARHFTDQRMTDKAKREAAAADAATDAHVADVPAPKKRPGRPARAAVV